MVEDSGSIAGHILHRSETCFIYVPKNDISNIMNELILKHTMNTVKKGQDNFKLKRYDTFCRKLFSLNCFVKLWGGAPNRWMGHAYFKALKC